MLPRIISFDEKQVYILETQSQKNALKLFKFFYRKQYKIM